MFGRLLQYNHRYDICCISSLQVMKWYDMPVSGRFDAGSPTSFLGDHRWILQIIDPVVGLIQFEIIGPSLTHSYLTNSQDFSQTMHWYNKYQCHDHKIMDCDDYIAMPCRILKPWRPPWIGWNRSKNEVLPLPALPLQPFGTNIVSTLWTHLGTWISPWRRGKIYWRNTRKHGAQLSKCFTNWIQYDCDKKIIKS